MELPTTSIITRKLKLNKNLKQLLAHYHNNYQITKTSLGLSHAIVF